MKELPFFILQKNDSIFVSLDANFGLVRKKNSGTSLEPPKHASKFFINQEEVDDYVDQYSTQTSSKEEHQVSSTYYRHIVPATLISDLHSTWLLNKYCRLFVWFLHTFLKNNFYLSSLMLLSII